MSVFPLLNFYYSYIIHSVLKKSSVFWINIQCFFKIAFLGTNWPKSALFSLYYQCFWRLTCHILPWISEKCIYAQKMNIHFIHPFMHIHTYIYTHFAYFSFCENGWNHFKNLLTPYVIPFIILSLSVSSFRVIVFRHCKGGRKSKDTLGAWLSNIIGKTLSDYFDLFAPIFEIFSVFMVLTSYYRTRIREEYSTTNCPERRNVQP